MRASEVLSGGLFHFILLAFIHSHSAETFDTHASILVLWFRKKSPEHDWKYVKYCNCMTKQTHTAQSQGPLGSPLLLGWHDTLFQPPTTKPHMETAKQFLHLPHIHSAIWCYFCLACALSFNLCSSEPNWAQLRRPSKLFQLLLTRRDTNMWAEAWATSWVLFINHFRTINNCFHASAVKNNVDVLCKCSYEGIMFP